MSVEINQNTEVVATNEKEPIEATANQEADEPSGEFESIRMESEEIETEDIFIEDDIDKVFTFSSEETLFEVTNPEYNGNSVIPRGDYSHLK